jgi:hypothetical protein
MDLSQSDGTIVHVIACLDCGTRTGGDGRSRGPP